MPAYLLIEACVGDRQRSDAYLAMVEQAIGRYDGRILTTGGEIEVLEGSWSAPEQLLIVAFDSAAQAKTFYNSPEYGTARAVREDAAIMNTLVVDGLPL